MRQIFGRSPYGVFEMWVRLHLLFWVTFFLSTTAFGEPLGIDTKGLDEVEIQSLSKLLSQGACPCDKNKSILACVIDQTCPAAKELASYGAEKFRAGLSALDVQQAVVKKYIQDHVYYDLISTMRRLRAADAKITVVEFADFQFGHWLASPSLSPFSKPNSVTMFDLFLSNFP